VKTPKQKKDDAIIAGRIINPTTPRILPARPLKKGERVKAIKEKS
jgi:hypothetical protein